MKKALRYLLIVVAMVSFLGVKAQGLDQLPEIQMQSTSVMIGSGSSLPQAATSGIYVTGSTPGSYFPAGKLGTIRRVGGDDFEEEEEPDKPGEPFPLGDVLWPLMACACIYIMRAARKGYKKAE